MVDIINRNTYIKEITENTINNGKISILLGSRRVGKTFIMKQFYDIYQDKSLYISFDDINLEKKFNSSNEFVSFVKLQSGKDIEYLFLDEIQLVPGISWILKHIYDTQNFLGKNKLKIIASGSGSFKIFSQIEDSLIGRAKYIHVYPLSFSEFLTYKGENLDRWYETYYESLFKEKKYLIDEYMTFGGFPEVVIAKSKEEKITFIKDILTSWYDKDIKLILKGDEYINFQKFFRYIGFRTGSPWKPSALSLELSLKINEVKKYFEIAKKSFVLFSLPILSKKLSTEISSGEKIYFTDNGLLNYILGNFNIENRGDLVENYVITSILKKQNDFVYFWKKKNMSEIDLIIKDILKGKFIPCEIKSGSSEEIPKIFKSFTENYDTGFGVLFNSNKKLEKNIGGFKAKIIPYIFVENWLNKNYL